ncbi:MAG: FHA domain-containing protein [Chloroflexota bacterium]|nr:FHA domain-containing protein [Chloroflexota bacterium]MDE2945653.1 FHA domain-containing protein [Chloroflexota bacterium]
MDEKTREPLAKLVWLDPFTGSTNEHPLREGDSVRIGRSASNDIQIAEGHVSREHAVVSCKDGAFTVDDVGSANGTFVNGVQVYGMNPLAIGDELHLFVSVLKLRSAAGEAREDVAEPVSAVAGDRASLRITRGPQRGQIFALLKEELYIGRSTPSSNWEIALQDPTVSRPHAFLVKEEGGWKLFDLGSINGTAVNSQPIAGGVAHNLRDGDRITFGGTMTVFHTGFPLRPGNGQKDHNGTT